MPPIVVKTNRILTHSNSEKIEGLCVWIAENSDSPIGWTELTAKSGLTHKELIALFQIHKHLTPMAYVRSVREQKKKSLPSHPQPNLFNNLDDTNPVKD